MTDNLTPRQRKFCMTRVKGKDTSIEKQIRSELHRLGYRFYKHSKSLPGKPDIVFPRKKIAVFIDGDFWHGYRFPQWQNNISDFWREKIGQTRIRDRRNFSRLRNRGWHVIRIWQHEIERDLSKCIKKITLNIERTNQTNKRRMLHKT